MHNIITLFSILIYTTTIFAVSPAVTVTELGPGNVFMRVIGADRGEQTFAHAMVCGAGRDGTQQPEKGTYKVTGSVRGEKLAGSYYGLLVVEVGLDEDQLSLVAGDVAKVLTAVRESSSRRNAIPAHTDTSLGNGRAGCKGAITGVGTVLYIHCSCQKVST